MADVTVVVPAHEEASRIAPVVAELIDEFDVLVVDDGSTDRTASVAREAGGRVREVEIETREVVKPRGVAWEHGSHAVHVLRYLPES